MKTRSIRCGFTLVEVMVAMALTVILMTALMRVATSSMQDRQRLSEHQQDMEPEWLDQVARQIEADLLMGAGVSGPVYADRSEGETRVFILTHNASGVEPGAPHLPTLVSYRLVASEQGGVLLREQRPLVRPAGVVNTASVQQTSVQVVATGIEAIQIGGTTLRVEEETRRLPAAGARNASAFMILIDNRPVPMQPIASQLPLAITTLGTTNNDPEQRRSFERTLLTQ